jgi:segregation and condensation protein B
MMDITQLKPIVEAMIFVAEEPLTETDMLSALTDEGVSPEELRACLGAMEADWNGSAERGVGLVRVAGGFQLRTKPEFAEKLRRLAIPKPMRLSAPALETLAIVAYRQPIMRAEIEKIRGVDSGAVLRTLLERRLLRIVGRSQEPGQPLLYGTTKEFLELFNLPTLKELPTLKDIDELMRERRAQSAAGTAGTELRAEDDEEELTEIVGDEEEEETEIIRRRPLDEDEEEEEKDMQALSELETELKDLRRLERHIFPKPVGEEGEGAPQEGASDVSATPAAEDASAEAPAVAEAGAGDAAPADAAPAEDPAPTPDRPFE